MCAWPFRSMFTIFDLSIGSHVSPSLLYDLPLFRIQQTSAPLLFRGRVVPYPSIWTIVNLDWFQTLQPFSSPLFVHYSSFPVFETAVIPFQLANWLSTLLSLPLPRWLSGQFRTGSGELLLPSLRLGDVPEQHPCHRVCDSWPCHRGESFFHGAV